MLKKLLNYEIKATGRVFLPLYLALIALTIITKLSLFIIIPETSETVRVNFSSIPFGISLFLYISLSVALIVMTLIVIIQRFYKNLLTDEGYLMFTLPVKTWQLILSKLIIAVMWSFICFLVVIVSMFILSGSESVSLMLISQKFSMMSAEFYKLFDFGMGRLVAEIILAGIIGFTASILMIYVSIAIGQLFNKNRILASFGAYVLINVALQIIVTVILVIVTSFGANYFETLTTNQDIMAFIELFLNASTVFNLLLGLLSYFVTQWILKKRLNLE